VAQFGKTVSVTGMNRLSTLLQAQGFTGINALSFLSLKTDDESVALKLYITENGERAPGVSQVETVTVVGTISGDGDSEWVITAAGMTGSPYTIAVPVLDGDTPAEVATKAAVVFNADDTLSEFFQSIEADDDDVVFTFWPAANDATGNIAYDNDTSTGLTPDATSASTTAGNIVPTLDGIEILDDVFMIGGGSGKVIDAGMAWIVPESGTLDVEIAAQDVGA
jgi:hypothetical protein